MAAEDRSIFERIMDLRAKIAVVEDKQKTLKSQYEVETDRYRKSGMGMELTRIRHEWAFMKRSLHFLETGTDKSFM